MRYFFDTADSKRAVHDEMGVDCASHDEARQLAETALGEMVCDTLPDGGEETFTVAVRSDAGQHIFQASLLFRSEWLVEEH